MSVSVPVSTPPRNRIAVVSGAQGALGAAICQRLADDCECVVALDVLPPAHPAAWRLDIACDIGSREQCRSAASAASALGPIDVLVNCAGITRDASLARMTQAMWDDLIRVNLTGAFSLCAEIMPAMRERRYGRIVNIASVNGQTGQFGQANYSAAKAGLHGLTMALAREGAARGVTVNTVAPGYCDTPMVRRMPQAAIDRTLAQIPVGRLGTPADIARAVAFLADPAAGYITGALLPVNGGYFMSF